MVPIATTEVDEKGFYRFENVPPGDYKVYACDKPINYVWGQSQAKVWPGMEWGATLLLPRFYARGQGYVTDGTTGEPITGAKVNLRLKDGSIWKTEYTNDQGWYNFDNLSEVEVIGYADIDLPDNSTYRGRVITETYNPDYNTPGSPTVDVTHNAMNRLIQWYTFNYRADLEVEPIPSGTGDINGFVYYDHFAMGSWEGDGIYEDGEERTLHGEDVELWNINTNELIATTKTGKFDKAKTLEQGWAKPYTWPPDEFGGVYSGELIGFYEFRDLAPGNYEIRVIPSAGFEYSPSPAAKAAGALGESTTVVAGQSRKVDIGANTRPVASEAMGVPLAGEIEGGVFDDLNVDNNSLSLLYFEKAGITGTPVGVYDHLGYRLGMGYMGNPLCYAGSTVCPAGEPPVQKPEVERRFAPGVHIFVGNDPTSPEYNPNYLPLSLAYMFGQGKYKFEADWSLVPIAFAFDGLNGAMLGEGPLAANNPPQIDNVGPGGSYIITGEDFGDEQGYSTVALSGTQLKVLSWSDTEIHVVDPVNIPNGPLWVTTTSGISNTWWFNNGEDNHSSQTIYVGEGLEYETITEALNNLPPLVENDGIDVGEGGEAIP